MVARRGAFRPGPRQVVRIALRAGQRRDGRPGQFRGALFGRIAPRQLHRRHLLSRQDACGVVEERLSRILRQGAQFGVLDRRGGGNRRRAARPGPRRGARVPPRAGHAAFGAHTADDRADAVGRGGRGGNRAFPLVAAPRAGRHPLCGAAPQQGRRNHFRAVHRRRRAQHRC